MEKINEIQKLIDNTEYWDARVFDCKVKYFGDEVQLIFEDEENSAFMINFEQCFKVSYENSFTLSDQIKVRDMSKGQLGYFMQDISLQKYKKNDSFIECSLDLSIMTIKIICKNTFIKKLELKDISFFWEENESNPK